MKWDVRSTLVPALGILMMLGACRPAAGPASARNDIRLKMPERPAVQAPMPSIGFSEAVPATRKGQTAEQDDEQKIDPFRPLFVAYRSDGAETVVGSRPSTPPFDLSGYRLTGVLKGPNGALALVEDATGRGHVLSPGRTFGDTGMVVVEIRDTGVLFQERYVDTEGNPGTRQRELKRESADARRSS